MGAVHLDRAHADAELVGHDLVHLAGQDQVEHFALARRQRCQARVHGRQLAGQARAGQSLFDPVHQCVVVEGFLEKVEGAPFQAVDRHRHVAVPGQEDHRQALGQVAPHQLVEHGHAVQVGHAHVEQHAIAQRVEVRARFIEEGARAGVAARGDRARRRQPGQRVAHHFFIVDDMQHGVLLWGGSGASGWIRRAARRPAARR